MTADSFFFFVFGGAAAVLGVLVISLKNPVHAAVALVANLFAIAALFALQDAHFLAALQVLVYAGAIMVLILFVIMLLNLKDEELGAPKVTAPKIIGGVAAALAAFALVTVISAVKTTEPAAIPADFGTVKSIGRMIFSTYLLPFETASILLLAAILGAVGIAKKKIW
jgi:NADH-quinone oxidoreductase subunit J